MLEIHTLDANYINPGLASIYMLLNKHHAAFIDTGTHNSTAIIKSALTEHDIAYTDVDYIILTHIHLDHSGGASHLMRLFPNAQLVVHPYGAKHMINPNKLIAGAKAVYKEKFHALYGDITAINDKRVIETFDGMEIAFQGETLTIIDTPGHANHHNCIFHEASMSCFTGDTFGLCYPHLSDEPQSLLPTTTPVQFSPEKLFNSIDKTMAHKPKYLYPTHFGKYTLQPLSIVQYKEHILNYCKLAERAIQENTLDSLEKHILDYMVNQIEAPINNAKDWLKMDAKLNADGLIIWQNKLNSP